MKYFNRLLFFALIALLPQLASSQIKDLPRSTPAAEGIESRAINLMIDSLMNLPETEIHHIMVVRHGKVVAEAHPSPFKAEYGHTLYSCSKTFTSMAVGIAIDENRLRLTDRVVTFFPGQLPDTIKDYIADLTVRDLLTMASGLVTVQSAKNFDMEAASQREWIKTWLSQPAAPAGKVFHYDSVCTFMLSAIVQRVTGKTLLEYLNEHLFGPMNITKLDWEQTHEGINTGGWGLRLQAESLAKLGILILNKGKWNGRQLVSEKWIEQATSKQISTENVGYTSEDWSNGYCYQMWCCMVPGAFRADGAYGQFIVMIPKYDLVVVINGNSNRTSDELKVVWRQLLPGVKNSALTADKGYKALLKTCATAALQQVKGKKTSPLATTAASRVIKLDKNRHWLSSIAFEPSNGVYNLKITSGSGQVFNIPCAYGSWSYRQSTDEPPYPFGPMSHFRGVNKDFITAGNYAWTSPRSITFKVEYVNWIHAREFAVEFNGNDVTVTLKDNGEGNNPEKIHGTLE
jgi:CubicO group peptidase (beta-lactamase class C family)